MQARLVEGLGAQASSVEATTLAYAASLACQLFNFKNWMTVEWHAIVAPYLTAFVSEKEAQAAASNVLAKSKEDAEAEAAVSERGGSLGCRDIGKGETSLGEAGQE